MVHHLMIFRDNDLDCQFFEKKEKVSNDPRSRPDKTPCYLKFEWRNGGKGLLGHYFLCDPGLGIRLAACKVGRTYRAMGYSTIYNMDWKADGFVSLDRAQAECRRFAEMCVEAMKGGGLDPRSKD